MGVAYIHFHPPPARRYYIVIQMGSWLFPVTFFTVSTINDTRIILVVVMMTS